MSDHNAGVPTRLPDLTHFDKVEVLPVIVPVFLRQPSMEGTDQRVVTGEYGPPTDRMRFVDPIATSSELFLTIYNEAA
jgi:hypothetical protein